MKNVYFLFSILAFGIILSLGSCTDDPVDMTAPSVSFLSGTGAVSADDSVPIYTPIKINVKADKGGAQLNTITVKVDGIQLAPLTFKVNGAPASANPALLLGTDKDGISYTYEFDALNVPGTALYEFTITDDNKVVTIKTIKVVFTGTPTTETGKGLIVYNYSGPRQGGVDLFNAKVISGNDPAATIRDYGVVDPLTNSLWVMRFTPRNGSIIKNPPAGFTYAGAAYQEDIQQAVLNGTNEQGSTDTKVLAIGDVFVVQNGTSYFVVSIDNLLFTSNDNLDYFQISIKK